MTVGIDPGDRPVTHELLDELPPVTALKEQLSKAVVHLVSASAGLTLGSWETDYDKFDATLSSSHNYDPYQWGPKLDIQLKCTGQQSAQRRDHVAWSVGESTYERLAAPNRGTMAILCVVVVPDHPGHWLTWPHEGLLAHCKAYYLRGSEFPDLPAGQESQTLHLPHENALTAPNLLGLMEEAAQWSGV